MNTQQLKSKKQYENARFPTKLFGDVVVLEYRRATEVVVQFENTGTTTTTCISLLKLGAVTDKYQPSVQGVGVIGDGLCRDTSGKQTKTYSKWAGMLRRCYGSSSYKPYTTCAVSPEFHYFPNFVGWYEKQVGHSQEGWHLDKDILVKGNKLYSPETCCLVPAEINCIFGNNTVVRGKYPKGVYYDSHRNQFQVKVRLEGSVKHLGRYQTVLQAFQAYKEAKESYIKTVANRWKDRIDPRVYQALMNWEIEIDD